MHNFFGDKKLEISVMSLSLLHCKNVNEVTCTKFVTKFAAK